MNEEPSFWNELLLYLEQGLVIPILGQDLLAVEYEGRTVNAYRLMAEKLAESLNLAPESLPNEFTLSQVIAAYPRFREKRNLVYTQIKSILDQLHLNVPEPLRLLARIPTLRIFLTTTFDPWMERALAEERGNGRSSPISIAYSTVTPAPDISAELLKSNQPVVFQLFGKVSPAPQYAATEEDLLEYLHHLQAFPPKNLWYTLRDHHLLFIGNAFSDWLERFFVRAARGERFNVQHGKEVFIVDNELRRSASMVSFFRGFCWETNVLPGNAPIDFVRSLHQKWTERHPATTTTVSPGPAPSTLAEPTSESHLIFLSYAGEDLAAASRLHSALSGVGLNVWLDQQGGLEAGDLYRKKIKRDIQRSTLFLPILSRNADQRKEGFFREEWADAIKRLPRFEGASRPFIVPVVIDDLDLYSANNIPDEFKEAHVTKAPQGVPSDESILRLQRLVRTIIKAGGALL
jgi:hypothetical protein